jgi:LysR family transcriptional activator of nhaA
MPVDLNFHHLKYFWTVAREGSIAKACFVLHVAQPTISGQLRELEKAVGEPLFTRAGRGLKLTDTGRMIASYCDEIFALGRELSDALDGKQEGSASRITVGISDQVPKIISCLLLSPALKAPHQARLTCLEGKTERLLADLATHQLDLVLSDTPLAKDSAVKAYNHLLMESTEAVFIAADHPEKARIVSGFPETLDGAPFILPAEDTDIRRAFDAWCAERNIRPNPVVTCQDSTLSKAFGAMSAGLYLGPANISEEICRMWGSVEVGRINTIKERFYAISVERRLTHPAVVAIQQAARRGR